MITLAIHITFFHSPNLQDQERLQTLVNMAATNMAMSIANAGHSFAMAASARDLSPAAHLSELFGGITQVWPLYSSYETVHEFLYMYIQKWCKILRYMNYEAGQRKLTVL